MQHRDIAEVRVRLESAIASLPEVPTNAAELLDRTEEIAIQILDSEHDLYPPGQLQDLLMSYLHIRQIELGLLQWPEAREEQSNW